MSDTEVYIWAIANMEAVATVAKNAPKAPRTDGGGRVIESVTYMNPERFLDEEEPEDDD